MADPKEPGQLAFETREKSHTPSASAMALAHWWSHQDADDRAAWAAVERAVRDPLKRKLAEAVEVVRDLLDDLDSTGRLQSDGPLERARALILPTDDWEARMYQKQESGK